MKIKLELFGASRDFSKKDYLEFDLKEKSSIKDLRHEILNFVIAIKQETYMVGFPIHSQDKNIDQLLNHDYTLVIVDQESNIKNTKRIVKCVINNSTNIQSNNKNNYIINIFLMYIKIIIQLGYHLLIYQQINYMYMNLEIKIKKYY